MNDRDAKRVLEAVELVARFLAEPLTGRIAALEHELDGTSGSEAARVVAASGIDGPLLDAALDARAELGRLNDLIHATVIALLLPRILEPEERVHRRPSLAAGNDPSRPFDLETDRRVAEFKMAAWKGSDADRKRQTVKDFMHLAADTSGRRRELYVVGQAPGRFLRTSVSTAAWALQKRSQASFFEENFGPPADTTIRDFTAGPGSTVAVIDLVELAPDVMNRLA